MQSTLFLSVSLGLQFSPEPSSPILSTNDWTGTMETAWFTKWASVNWIDQISSFPVFKDSNNPNTSSPPRLKASFMFGSLWIDSYALISQSIWFQRSVHVAHPHEELRRLTKTS